MGTNILYVPDAIQSEVQAGLAVLKKNGYRVTAQEQPNGELYLHFNFGENEQTLKFADQEWQHSGVIEKRIVDQLEI